MTDKEYATLIGVIVSLLFSYFPGLKSWFDALKPNVKRILQLGVAFVVAGAIFGLSCAEVISAFTCDVVGAKAVVVLFLNFLIGNQTAYLLAPRKL